MRRRTFVIAAGLPPSAHLTAFAQTTFPERVVTIVNSFPSGPTDAYGRLIARKLQEKWGQAVIVDGRAGAGGSIAVNQVAKAKPDGYTLLVTSASTTIHQPVVRKSLPYNAEKELIPLLSTGQTPQLIVAHPSLPVRSLGELIAYARTNPSKVTYGSSGAGTALHLAGELFASEANVKLLHIPYKSAAQAVTDLLGGQVQLMFDSVANSGPHIRSGRLRGLAVMGPRRVEVLPDIPTAPELGRAGMQFANWLGLYAPAGTPPNVVDRIVGTIRPLAIDADFKAFYDSAGMTHTPLFGAEFAQASREERSRLAALVKKAGIPLID